jgi:hypothetical protein
VVQHFAGGSRRGTWRWFGFVLASVVAGVLILSTLVVLVNSRDDDIPSANADIHPRYAGRLFTGVGQPLVSRVDLKLRSSRITQSTVTTDEDGRFCVTFPQEPELGIVSPSMRSWPTLARATATLSLSRNVFRFLCARTIVRRR